MNIDEIGAHTHGTSRKDAVMMLGDAIVVLVDRKGSTAPSPSSDGVGRRRRHALHRQRAGLLAALLLRDQREIHRLTLADVATLRASTPTRGTREPSRWSRPS